MSFSMEDRLIFLMGGNYFTALSESWEDFADIRRYPLINPGTAIALLPTVRTMKRGGP
jgi:hypothetical protein